MGEEGMSLSSLLRTAKPRMKKCEACGSPFAKQRMGQKVCGQGCAVVYAIAQKEKIVRKEIAVRREAIKTRSQWLAEAQTAFNAFIRERDSHLPCISCGRFHTGSYDAGHYRSVGSMPALRFNEDNCHRQCVPCNQHKAGNVVEYRIGLVARIGVDRVAFLEGPHEPAKFTIDDAKAIKAEYKAKLKALQINKEQAA
jgi:hypothetical protein